jgi:CHASE2 domain-containing sensor protein
MLVAAAAVAALTSAAYLHHVFGSVEDSTMDRRFAIRGAHTPKDVALVAIDDRTMSDMHLRWPFPRRYHAEVIEDVANDHPRAIAVDIQFTEPTDPQDDNALIDAVGSADSPFGRVVLGALEYDRTGHADVFGGPEVVRSLGARAGFTGYEPDASGVFRNLPWGSSATWIDGSPAVPLESFALVAAEIATGRQIPRSRIGGSTTIAYVGPPGTVPLYSYVDVLRHRVPRATFAGKVVVIGGTASSLQDFHTTPYGAGSPMAGPEIEANSIETALHGFPLRPSRTRDLLLIVLFAFLVPVASLFLRWRWCLLVGAVAAAAYLVAAQLSFDHGVLLAVTWPLLALALGTLAAGFLHPRRPPRPAYD